MVSNEYQWGQCIRWKSALSLLSWIHHSGHWNLHGFCKVQVILGWALPQELNITQHFIGIVKLCIKFTRHFSMIITPITALPQKVTVLTVYLLPKSSVSLWNPWFQLLYLHMWIQTLLFSLEVNASKVGAGAILSQHLPSANQLHPCIFSFLRKFSL